MNVILNRTIMIVISDEETIARRTSLKILRISLFFACVKLYEKTGFDNANWPKEKKKEHCKRDITLTKLWSFRYVCDVFKLSRAIFNIADLFPVFIECLSFFFFPADVEFQIWFMSNWLCRTHRVVNPS